MIQDDSDHASRRTFLKKAASLAPGAAALAPLAGLSSAVLAESRTSDPVSDLAPSAPRQAHPAQADYKPTFFTPAEWAFINAACARLIPADQHGPGAVEAGVPQFIDRQLGTPWADGAIWYMSGPFFETSPLFGYQSPLTPKQQYRLAIRAIDALCQDRFKTTFAALTPIQQDAVLKDMESGKATAPDLSLKTFFTSFLLENTLEGFFGDPMYGGNKNMAAWTMIGHPGARADFLDWVARPNPIPTGRSAFTGIAPDGQREQAG